MKTAAIEVAAITSTAVPTRNSKRVIAAQRARLGYEASKSISGNVSGHLKLAQRAVGSPTDGDRDLFSVSGVRFAARKLCVQDLNEPGVSEARFACGDRIEFRLEVRRHKPWRVELGPGVEADGVHLFRRDLRGSKCFSRSADDSETLIESKEKCDKHHAEHGQPHDHLDQRKAETRRV